MQTPHTVPRGRPFKNSATTLPSGGTIASGINIAKEASANPSVRKDLVNPYLLCPKDHAFTARQHNVGLPECDVGTRQRRVGSPGGQVVCCQGGWLDDAMGGGALHKLLKRRFRQG